MIKNKNIIIEGPRSRPILIDVFYTNTSHDLPVIVFCHGYKGFKDWGAWDLMAEYFANNGFCFVKFNFSFNGGTVSQPIDFPDLDAFGQNNYSTELNDLDTVLNWIEDELAQEIQLDQQKITLIGHSRGGGIVTLKTAEDSRIAKVVSLAGVSDFKIRFNIDSEEFREWQQTGVKYVLNGRTKQNMPHYFQFFEDFIQNEKRLTISHAASNITVPHLIIHGDNDTSVRVEEAYALHKWNAKSILKVIEGANHVFGAAHPWTSNELPNEMIQVCQLILDFIKSENHE